MAEILEMIMVICFGLSWPISIIKTLKMKCSTGKSPLFISFIVFGYICGIISKILFSIENDTKLTYVFIFYCINLVMTSFDLSLLLYYKYKESRAKLS